MSFAHSPQIITNGLVLALDAGNTKSYVSGSTTWFDKSGYGNNGTLINGVGYTSSFNGSLVFDGTNDYVTFGNISTFNFGLNPFTVSLWIYPTAWDDGTSRGIIDKKTNDSANGWVIYNDGGTPANSLRINARLGLQNNFVSNTVIPVNKWQNWIFTRDSNYIQSWYYNGVLDKTGVSNSTNISDTAVLDIGRSKTWGGWFQGNMSLTQIYNRALSSSEVQQNFNALRGRFGI